jgi:hypothetical protein
MNPALKKGEPDGTTVGRVTTRTKCGACGLFIRPPRFAVIRPVQKPVHYYGQCEHSQQHREGVLAREQDDRQATQRSADRRSVLTGDRRCLPYRERSHDRWRVPAATRRADAGIVQVRAIVA